MYPYDCGNRWEDLPAMLTEDNTVSLVLLKRLVLITNYCRQKDIRQGHQYFIEHV